MHSNDYRTLLRRQPISLSDQAAIMFLGSSHLVHFDRLYVPILTVLVYYITPDELLPVCLRASFICDRKIYLRISYDFFCSK